MRAKTYDPKLAPSSKDRANFNDFKKSLQKMLKDVKNTEYKDQIYFTLAQLQLKNKDTISGIKSLQLSTKNHISNNNQKLDYNFLGVPTEQFGFSNNVMGLFGSPSFDQASFRIDKESKITLKAR